MIVVDTSVFVAIILGEPDAPRFEDRLAAASRIGVSSATELETMIVVHLRLGAEGHRRLETLRSLLSWSIIGFDASQARIAIGAYRRFGRGSGHRAKLNFGDCFSYALARSLDAPLLFKGDDFGHTDIRSALDAAL